MITRLLLCQTTLSLSDSWRSLTPQSFPGSPLLSVPRWTYFHPRSVSLMSCFLRGRILTHTESRPTCSTGFSPLYPSPLPFPTIPLPPSWPRPPPGHSDRYLIPKTGFTLPFSNPPKFDLHYRRPKTQFFTGKDDTPLSLHQSPQSVLCVSPSVCSPKYFIYFTVSLLFSTSLNSTQDLDGRLTCINDSSPALYASRN